MQLCICMHVFPSSSVQEKGKEWSAHQLPNLGVLILFPTQKNWSSLEKWLIARLGRVLTRSICIFLFFFSFNARK